jgi:hypothetical protein
MSLVQTVLVTLSSFLVLVGAFGLIAAWVTPSLLDGPVLRWLITGKRLAPTRSNRTLMSLWAMLIGCQTILTVLGYRAASLIVFAIWLPFAVLVLKRLWLAAKEA